MFTILTGAAPALGIVYVFFGAVTPSYEWLCGWGFGVATLWSAWVLFIPGTFAEANVAGKITYYRNPAVERQSDTLVIQRGEICFPGFGPIAVEFPTPFRDAPKIEVINFRGYNQQKVPEVENVTAHQVTFKRKSVGGDYTPESQQVYRWIAPRFPRG